MDIPADLLPDVYLWVSSLLCLVLISGALLTAPWSKIVDNEAQHIFLGAIVALSLLWIMRGGIQQGLNFHLLGMTPVSYTHLRAHETKTRISVGLVWV